jgi:hypothetical protein
MDNRHRSALTMQHTVQATFSVGNLNARIE